MALECLMNWWRLMDSPNYRLEVTYVERPRMQVTIPADHVKWVMTVHMTAESSVQTNEHGHISALHQERLAWDSNITLAIWRVLKELTLCREVTMRWPNMPMRHDDECLDASGYPTMRRAPRDDQIITLAHVQYSENALNRRRAAMNEN